MGLETYVLGPDHALSPLTWSLQGSHLPSPKCLFLLPPSPQPGTLSTSLGHSLTSCPKTGLRAPPAPKMGPGWLKGNQRSPSPSPTTVI